VPHGAAQVGRPHRVDLDGYDFGAEGRRSAADRSGARANVYDQLARRDPRLGDEAVSDLG
jgi:hypothetical protein